MDQGSQAETGSDVTPVNHAPDQLMTGSAQLIKVVEDGGLDHYDGGVTLAARLRRGGP